MIIPIGDGRKNNQLERRRREEEVFVEVEKKNHLIQYK